MIINNQHAGKEMTTITIYRNNKWALIGSQWVSVLKAWSLVRQAQVDGLCEVKFSSNDATIFRIDF